MGKTRILNWGLLAGLLSLLLFIGGCVPSEAPGAEGGGSWTPIIFLGLLFVIFYFLLIRPQRKKQKEHQHLVEELRKGDRVITAGGIYGQIESLDQDSAVLKIESGVTIRIARASIAGKREQ
ncbi:preprotein translocase subunit YajC [Chloroflexota bacterium]